MDWNYLLTSLDGRITRKPFWISVLVIAAVFLVLTLLLTIITGGSARAQVWIQIVTLAVIGYPITAVLVKRLHDRDRPGNLAGIMWAPTVLSVLGQLTGLTGDYVNAQGWGLIFVPNTAGLILIGMSLFVAVWALIELGILRGTDGTNHYGPDPLYF